MKKQSDGARWIGILICLSSLIILFTNFHTWWLVIDSILSFFFGIVLYNLGNRYVFDPDTFQQNLRDFVRIEYDKLKK